MTTTRPDPHASFREHASSEAEAVEEESAPKSHRGKYTLIEVTELADLRAQLAYLKIELAKSCDDTRFADSDAGCTRAIVAEAQLATARQGLEEVESEAQRYAEMYPQSSDGRNAFIIFRDMVSTKIAALNSGEQKQIEDWPYPEGNPTCAQDLK